MNEVLGYQDFGQQAYEIQPGSGDGACSISAILSQLFYFYLEKDFQVSEGQKENLFRRKKKKKYVRWLEAWMRVESGQWGSKNCKTLVVSLNLVR